MKKNTDRAVDFEAVIEDAKQKSKDLNLDFLDNLPLETTKAKPMPFPYGSSGAKPYGWFLNLN